MPPIDLPRLRVRTAALAADFGDVPAVLAGIRSLLEDYADRSHRPSERVAVFTPANSFKAPAPVLRQIVTALRVPVRADPAAGLALAQGLWVRATREERRLAADLAGLAAARAPAEALALIESWLPQLESGPTADALAEHGLRPLLALAPSAYVLHARRWVEQPQRWTRRFAVAVLSVLARERAWDGVPDALAILRVAMEDSDPDVRRAVVDALAGLLPRSPGEVKRFLREQAGRVNPNAQLVLRGLMARLPPAEQQELLRAMRS